MGHVDVLVLASALSLLTLAKCQLQRQPSIPTLASSIHVHPLSFGDTNIVATVPLRSASGCVRTAGDSCQDCIDDTGMQLAAAFHFAVELINQRRPLPSKVTLGALLANSLSTCTQRTIGPSSTLGAQLTSGMITVQGDNFLELLSLHRVHHRVLSMIDLVDVDSASRTTIEGMVYVLLLFGTPEILLSSPPGTTIIPDTDPLLMRFEPVASQQVTAIAYLVQRFQLERVVVVTSGNDQYWSAAASSFSAVVSTGGGACVGANIRLLGSQGTNASYALAASQVNDLAAAYAMDGGSTAFILLATVNDAEELFKAMLASNSPNVLWIATEPWNLRTNWFDYRELLQGMLVVADQAPPGQAQDFMNYYTGLIKKIRDDRLRNSSPMRDGNGTTEFSPPSPSPSSSADISSGSSSQSLQQQQSSMPPMSQTPSSTESNLPPTTPVQSRMTTHRQRSTGSSSGQAASTNDPANTPVQQSGTETQQPAATGIRPGSALSSSSTGPAMGGSEPSVTPSESSSHSSSSGGATQGPTASQHTTPPGIVEVFENASISGNESITDYSDIPVSDALDEMLQIYVEQRLAFCEQTLKLTPLKSLLNSQLDFDDCNDFLADTPKLQLAQRSAFLIDSVALLAAGLRGVLRCNERRNNTARCQLDGKATPADAEDFVQFLEDETVIDGFAGFKRLNFRSGLLNEYRFSFHNLQSLQTKWDMNSVGQVLLDQRNTLTGSSPFADFKDLEIGSIVWPNGTGRPRAGVCEPVCPAGSFRVENHPPAHLMDIAGECCWTCMRCPSRSITNRSNEESCRSCRLDEITNANQTDCVILPVVRLGFNDVAAIAVMCVSGGIFLFAAFIAVIFVRYRRTPVIRSSSFELSLVALAAIGLQVLVSPVYFIEPSEVSCEVGFALFFVIYTVLTSTLLMKSYKIWYIFQAKKHLDKSELFFLRTTFQVLCICVLTGISVGMVIIISVLDQIKAEHLIRENDQLLVCSESNAMFFVMIGYTCILTLVSLVLAFKVRKLPARFNDAHFLMITFSISLIVFLFLIIISQQSEGFQNPLWFPVTAAMWSFAALVSLFLPKVYIVLFRPEKNKTVSTFSHTATKLNMQSTNTVSASMQDSPLSKAKNGGAGAAATRTAYVSSVMHTKSVDYEMESTAEDLDP
eukprot:scpid15425/ scgid9290/ Extracellular calcium-sensing receptor; Parathyroid cell calcium-sensing receptor